MMAKEGESSNGLYPKLAEEKTKSSEDTFARDISLFTKANDFAVSSYTLIFAYFFEILGTKTSLPKAQRF
jgi:hypothetical protein